MTCGHCANFHKNVFPELKEKYIDTGKVRFIFASSRSTTWPPPPRCWRAAPAATRRSRSSRCCSRSRTSGRSCEGNPVPKLFEIAKQAGFTQESFDKCLTDQKLLDDITAVRTRASDDVRRQLRRRRSSSTARSSTARRRSRTSTRCSSRCWQELRARVSSDGAPLVALLLLPTLARGLRQQRLLDECGIADAGRAQRMPAARRPTDCRAPRPRPAPAVQSLRRASRQRRPAGAR